MMSDPRRRRRSPESSRRRPKSRRDSKDYGQSIVEEPTARGAIPFMPPQEEATFSTADRGLASSYYSTQQSQFASSPTSFTASGGRPIDMRSNEQTPHAPSVVPIPADLNRPQRIRRHGSRSSLDSSSASSSSSSSYLDISRWYPSWGRGGGVLKTFFKTPSEHRPRRRRSQRKMHKKTNKKTKGVFVFGSNNSSTSSVNSDMAYGMGFLKKPKSRGGGFAPIVGAAAAASVSARERSEGRPGVQRRQTDEEIMEIGRKLQDVARMQNRADYDKRGKSSWESYQRQSSSGMEMSSRGLGSLKHSRRRRQHASSSDDEWESASEGEDSDEMSALAYGHTPIPTPRPAKSSISRMSTASAIAAGSALVAGSAIAASRAPDGKSAVVDPKLFGPQNSLRDFVNTPCGFNDNGGAHTFPGRDSEPQNYAGSAESASIEARPLQRVFPLQTSDPGRVEATRASGSVVSSQQNYSSVLRDRVYSTTSLSHRPEPVPIQAPKPINPVPSRIYDDERIRDNVPSEPVEKHRRKPTSDNKIYAETALVGAGVAALGAAILAGRGKGEGKDNKSEEQHGKHEKYGHEDHRQEESKAEDARKAQELRLMQEIERLERALGKTNKAREQRRRDSKRERDSGSLIDAPADDRRKSEIRVEEDKDYERERERRRRERQSKRGEPSDYDSRVSEPGERPALVEDSTRHRRDGGPSQTDDSAPIDVFQFQVPDDAFTTGDTPPKAPSPYIIDVTPSPSPAPEQRRGSRQESLAEETRDAHRIYEEAHHSTAPIPEVVMAAAIGAVAHSRGHHDEEEESRGRTNARTADIIQEEANKFYAARRLAEREIRSRSRSRSHDDPVPPVPRIVTPPEMQNRPPKNPFSGANADFRFDMEMSPTQLLGYWPEVAPVRDPSAERPRPVLNLVMPTPEPTPSPERQRKKAAAREPEPVEQPKQEVPSVVLGPRGEVVQVVDAVEEPSTPSTSKRVSWGPSEFKQYEEHSPERSYEHSPPSEKPKKGFGGWGTIAAAVTGAGVGAAIAHDNEPKSPRRDERSNDEKRSSGSRSPPKERPVLSSGMSSRVLTEEPEELPPAPGPKPASPRNSQQMPGAFSDDIDFAATLAAGLEHSGFDPDIVIDNPEYHRRDSPPGSNEPYTQPFAETVSDLGVYSVSDGYGSQPREHGYVIGELDTPSSEKKAPLVEDFENSARGKNKKDMRSSSIYDDIEVVEEPEEAEPDTSKLSKKERRKLEKAAQAAKIVEEEVQAAQPQATEASQDEWADASTSKKSKKSKKAKRSSVAWDDAETPVNDTRVSVPVNAFDDIKDARSVGDVDDWDTPKKSKKSKRDSRGYDLPGDDPPDKEKRDRRRTELYEPLDRDVASVVSDSRYDDDRSNGHSNGDDDRSVASAPSGSKRDSKRSSSGFWGLLGGKEQQQSKKDNAGTLGAGAGLAGVAAVAMAAVAGSDAAEASSGHTSEKPYVDRDVPKEAEVFEDPEIAPRVIKPAIDPQYGDLLPLPPSPGEDLLEFDEEDALPALPDSRPNTPPGQAPAIVRERENSTKRPHFATHVRRTSTAEATPRSPSHTAIPIQFRMGHRSMPATSPAIGSRSSPVVQSPTTPAQESPPMFKRSEFSPTNKRQPPRPTSWDSSREIKPLYLLERSARPFGEEEQRDEVAQVTPLPPSRESPVPEDQLAREEPVGLGVDANPLVIDTEAARSADYGSQEATPTGLKPVEQLKSSEQEAEITPLGFPSSSSLPESSYATPGEFPREFETPSSPRFETLPTEASVDKNLDKSEKKSYFPSALSMLPAATLAGVGVFLGRGKKDEAQTTVDDHKSRLAADESLLPAAGPVTEPARELPSEAGRVDQTAPTESEFEPVAQSDSHEEVSESPFSKAIDPQSPADFQDAQTEFPPIASLEARPEATEVIPETPIDTADLTVQTRSKKKGKKGKKKQSISDVPQPTDTADQSYLASSNTDDTSIKDNANMETVEEPSILAPPSTALAPAQHSETDFPETIATVEQKDHKQSTPSQPDAADATAAGQLEDPRDLSTSQRETRDVVDPDLSEKLDNLVSPQPEVISEEPFMRTSGQDEAANVTSAIGEPSSPKLETGDSMDAVPVLPVDSEEAQSTHMVMESAPQEIEPAEDDWATLSSKKRKNKKKKKQSFSLAEQTTDSPVPTSSIDDRAIDSMQESALPQDSSGSKGVVEPPREVLQEPLETTVQPLNANVVRDDIAQHGQMGQHDLAEDPAVLAPTGVQLEESSRDIPAEETSMLPRDYVREPEPDVSQFLDEEPAARSPQPDVSQYLVEEPAVIPSEQQGTDPVSASAEEEYPIISKKSKKNKKRKSSKGIDELVPSSAVATSADREYVEVPEDLPQESTLPAEEGIEPTTSPSETKEIANASEDADWDVTRNFSPGEVVESAEAWNDRSSSVQQDTQPETLRPGSQQELPVSPTLSSHVPQSQSGMVPEDIELSTAEPEPTPKAVVNETTEPEVILGKTTQPSDSATELTAFPVHSDTFTKASSLGLEHESSTPQDLSKPLEEAEVVGDEADTSTTKLEQGDFEQQEDFEQVIDEEEATRREVEAAQQIQEEEAEISRLQLKRKPSKKDKSRLKDLKAKAQQRAEESEVAASYDAAQDLEQPEVERQVVQASDFVDDQPTGALSVEEPILAERTDLTANVPESREADPVWETPQTAEQDIETFHSADESARAVSHIDSRELEDPEELARREAEAEQVRDEESELARLKLKRKPSKKDKSRIKTLEANAEQRDQEAEEQAAVTQDAQDEIRAHTDVGQDIVAGPADDVSQPLAGSEALENDSQPRVDSSTGLVVEDKNASDSHSTAQSHVDMPILDTSESHFGQDASEFPVETSETSQRHEHHVDHGHESAAQEQPVEKSSRDIEDPLPILGRSEAGLHDVAKDITEHPSASSDKPKNNVGGWGLIAAAVAGAGVGATLGKDDQPKRIQESQILPGDHSNESSDATTKLESQARDIQDESSQSKAHDAESRAGGPIAGPHEEVAPAEVSDPTSAHLEDLVSNTEPSYQEKDVTSTLPNLELDQTAATEVQPDSEWSMPAKKSKKDKKKKRKGTLSGGSGQTSGLATPLDTTEAVIVPEPVEVDDVGAFTSQGADVSPVVDREIAPVEPFETGHSAQDEFAPAESRRDDLKGNVAASALDDLIPDAKEGPDLSVGASGHLPDVNVAQIATVDEAESVIPGPESNMPLEELMDLPASLARSTEAASSTAEPVHPATEQDPLPADQDLFREISHHADEPPQPVSSANDPVLAVGATEDTAPQDQDTDAATETNRILPTETDINALIVDEPQQLQDDEFSWAPAKKKDKKKKKRGSVAWSEPTDDPQTPVGEEAPEPSTRGFAPETSDPTEYLPQHEQSTEPRETQPQLDDWSPITSSKKKKKDKKKKASFSSWEPENSPKTPLDDDTSEVHDVLAGNVGPSGVTDSAAPPVQPVEILESLQQEPGSIIEPDLKAGQDDEKPLPNEDTNQFPSQALMQAEAPKGVSSDKPAVKTDLESGIEAGGKGLDAELPLTGNMATSPPLTPTEHALPGETAPVLDLDNQVEQGDEPVITTGEEAADQAIPVAGDVEDTFVVAGEKVADEVSEPWAFEATHDSPTMKNPDLDATVENNEDSLLMASKQPSDDLVEPPLTQDDGKRITEAENDFLDVDRPASRPSSPAPWGDDDYSTSQRFPGLGDDRLVGRSPSPELQGDEQIIPTGQDGGFLDNQGSVRRPESPVPSDDNNSAFVTPFEDAHVLAAEPYPILSSDLRQEEEQPSEWTPTKKSKQGKKDNKKADISQSLDPEPEPSFSVLDTPQFEESVEQQSFAESVEAPGLSDPIADEAVEPATNDVDDWVPKKLNKKEKRKAKKNSVSAPQPEGFAKSLEDPEAELVPESQDQTPTTAATSGEVQQEDPIQSEFSRIEQPADTVEQSEGPSSDRPLDIGSFPVDHRDSAGLDPPVEVAEALQPEEGEISVERQIEPKVSMPEEGTVAAAAAVAAVPVLARKMSKKEKRKAKKASSSWEDDAFGTSPPQAPAIEGVQIQEAPIVASPIEESHSTREPALDVDPTNSQPDQEVSANLETSTAAESIADDEWAVPLSRKKSKGKKKKGKQLSLDQVSGTQTPTTEEPTPLSANAEIEESPRSADHTAEETLAQSADYFSVPTSPLRPAPANLSEPSGGTHLEPKPPATLGTDLQKMPSAAPSPDPWESEDYFKPKIPGDSPSDPPEEPFEKLEIHPAFTRGLDTASKNRSQDERPLVGLGLIHRHSSIFQEDDGHTPKLLTLTSDNASIESLAIEETSQTGASTKSQETSDLEDSRELPGQSVDPALEGRETVGTIDAGLERQADILSGPEAAVPSSSTHPQRRFPLSPRLSPSFAPEDPPKSPIPDEIKLSQRGSVAMLAQRFGGKRKKVSKYVDKRTPVEDDLFDDPSMWEGAERKAVDGSRMDEDAGDFWAVEDTHLDDEPSGPDVHPGQGSASSAHGSGTQQGDDNVSATHSSPGPDAGRFTPELSEKANREEEVPLEPMVESPILGSQASNEIPSPDPQLAAHSPSGSSHVGTSQTTHRPTNIADTWDLIGARNHRDDRQSARSGSPVSDRGVGLEESVLPSVEAEHGQSHGNFIPAVDFRRSVSRGLPPVQEEPTEEDAELVGKHTTSLVVTTPDINRDSGFVTDSPNEAWTRRFDDAQQRDSGVHMRDYRARSPGLRSSRGGSPEPNRVSRSSIENEGAGLVEKPKRSPLAKYERNFREDTPVLEAQDPPVTPEPQKSRSDGSRAHKYPDLGPGATTAAALAGGAALLAAQNSGTRSPSASPVEGQRSVSDSSAGKQHASTPTQPEARRAASNSRMSRARTPEPLNLRPTSPSLLRHSGTPPLRSRRTRSGDLRTLSQSSNQSHSDLGIGAGTSPSPVSGRAPTPAAAAKTPVPASSSSSSDLRRGKTPAAAQTSTANPVANEGRVRTKDMADVYDGFGEGRMGSPRSPTRPHSMRRRQSMQVLDLENRVEQLMAENRALAEAKTQAELHSSNKVTSSLAERDNEIEALKQSLDFMRKEINRLTEVNEGLNSAISQSAVQHQDRYRLLETQHSAITGELDNFRSQYGSHAQAIEAKDAEIRSLREQLEATKEQVREMQKQILATNPADSDFLRIKDVDYFDHRCQQLCSHVQQWVLRFSKFSDMRACRLTTELNDEKIIDRLDNAVLDGANVDGYLNDRVRRRDVFMSVAMTMIWEFVFTRYLFGMDREQRQKLKVLEKLLLEVGPPKAVRQWRAVTLTLLSKRDAFKEQREQDTEAVVQAVFQTLSMILPPPSNLEDQIQGQLRKVLREAVDLSIEMRTQRAEYMMLPPLQPEYDASGELAEPHPFNAQLMSERSGDKSKDDDLQAEGAIVRVVLFPLVVKKGDDEGVGDDEVVVCPAQVIVKKPRSSSRRSMRAPSSDAGGVSLLRGGSPSTAPNRSNVSMAEAEYIEGGF